MGADTSVDVLTSVRGSSVGMLSIANVRNPQVSSRNYIPNLDHDPYKSLGRAVIEQAYFDYVRSFVLKTNENIALGLSAQKWALKPYDPFISLSLSHWCCYLFDDSHGMFLRIQKKFLPPLPTSPSDPLVNEEAIKDYQRIYGNKKQMGSIYNTAKKKRQLKEQQRVLKLVKEKRVECIVTKPVTFTVLSCIKRQAIETTQPTPPTLDTQNTLSPSEPVTLLKPLKTLHELFDDLDE